MNRRYLSGRNADSCGIIPKTHRWVWRDVPAAFKTRRQWLKGGRKVKRSQKPTAEAIYPRWLKGHERLMVGAADPHVLKYADWGVLVTDTPTPLFHLDQTQPYKPTKRTRAFFAYESIYLDRSQRSCWIKKTEKDGSERPDWFTVVEDEAAEVSYERNLLTETVIRSHLNGKHIIGVRASDTTQWVKIDLDFHDRDLQVFEQQAEALLEVFHGDGWHYEVKREDVTGLNLLKVLSKPRKTKVVLGELRRILRELDARFPELAKAARKAGMKTLAELEIYPTETEGTRLPLCRDRVVFLDKPLPLITTRRKQVQDVEGYVAWLNDPNRRYMPKEKVLGYLHYFAWPTGKPKAEKVKVDWANGEIALNGWFGNARRYLHDFWLDGNANGKPLNEHIVVLCRLAARYGYSETTTVNRLVAFVEELPPSAKSCSSRLLKAKSRKVENVIRTSAKYAYSGNGHQTDAATSTLKIDQVFKAWPEFDPLDKSTWKNRKPVRRSNVVPKWSDSMKRQLTAYFRKPLFTKDERIIIRFVDAIINLTLDKQEQRQGWHKDFLFVWMKDHFPEIKSAKDEKRQRIMKALEEVGIIRLVARGYQGRSCSRWELGKTAKQALGAIDNQEPIELPELAVEDIGKTSIYSSSLFQNNYEEWRRTMIEVVGETFETEDQRLLSELGSLEGLPLGAMGTGV